MAALLCALVSWVAMAFEGAVGIDAAAVSAQPNIRTLIDVSASFAVYRWEEALVAQAAVGTSQVLTVTVRADARLLTLINIIADASTGFMTRQAGDTLVGAWRVLTLFIGASVGIQTLIYVFTGWTTV